MMKSTTKELFALRRKLSRLDWYLAEVKYYDSCLTMRGRLISRLFYVALVMSQVSQSSQNTKDYAIFDMVGREDVATTNFREDSFRKHNGDLGPKTKFGSCLTHSRRLQPFSDTFIPTIYLDSRLLNVKLYSKKIMTARQMRLSIPSSHNDCSFLTSYIF